MLRDLVQLIATEHAAEAAHAGKTSGTTRTTGTDAVRAAALAQHVEDHRRKAIRIGLMPPRREPSLWRPPSALLASPPTICVKRPMTIS